MRLEGKVCIITGASGGMGAVATQLFRAEGATVVAADLEHPSDHALAETSTDSSGQSVFVRADVSREDDCKTLVDETVRRFGRLDVLYNNAGIMPRDDHSVLDAEVELWERIQRVNVGSVVLCSKHAVPAMIASGGGSVINVASFVAFLGCTVPQDAYTASKGAIVSLTRSMAVQFGPRGVRTNVICPGPIETPLSQGLLSGEEGRGTRLGRVPMGRFGRPEDVVYLALHLASDESAWTNGASIIVDGGISCNYF